MREVPVRPSRAWHDFVIFRSADEINEALIPGAALVTASGEVVAIEALGPCKKVINLAQAQMTQAVAQRINGGKHRRLVDWSKAESCKSVCVILEDVDASGSLVRTRTGYRVEGATQGGQKASFFLELESELNRLMFAMEFLKTACPLQSDTGFCMP